MENRSVDQLLNEYQFAEILFPTNVFSCFPGETN